MDFEGLPYRPRGAAGRPRKGEEDGRRTHVIAVATALFLESGFHQVSLARIARNARVAVRTIYSSFGGKAGLFQAVLQTIRKRFLDEEKLLAPAASDIAGVLGHFGLRYLRFLADPQVARIRRMALADAGGRQDLAHAFLDADPGLQHGQLARYFADERVREKIRSDVPVELLPTFFIACVAGDYLWPAITADVQDSDEHLQRHLEGRLPLFLRAVLHHPA